MRRTLVVLLTVLMAAPQLTAKNKHGWENVEKLKAGTSVSILQWSGERFVGRIYNVTDTGLQIATIDLHGGNGPIVTVERPAIWKIVRIRLPRLPNPKRWMLAGAVVGGAIGVAAGAASDVHHGDNGRWIVGGAAGAGAGFMGSCVVLGTIGVVSLPLLIFSRKLVYEGKRPVTGRGSY